MPRPSPKASTGRSLWERQRAAIRQSKAAQAVPPAQPAPVAPAPPPPPPPALGAFRIEQLRLGQCRFACTADNAPPGAHRFCGAATEVGPGNLHGSWCPEHLALVVETKSRLAQPAFLKNAAQSGRR